ncbi:MAG: exodeoxyribonuclease VII large subunit [Bryobacteraceae bacterium]
MEQTRIDWSPGRQIRSVSELTAAIRSVLARSFDDVWVSGEISGLKAAPSGHVYFTLKDRAAQIRCVCFKSSLRFMKFKPQEGIAAVARGKLDVFEQRGDYQLLVEWLEPQGFGALQMAFERLKAKLETEGLFAQERKRALPRFPRRIGIVTSPAGAVIQDMLHILKRRWPGIHVRLYPTLVQGVGSVEGVVDGLGYFSETGWADVVIVGRGGGSIEDLWTFNEESVARAIAACQVPVISAVGHETDFTIADFVADLRAPTPSAAAELVVPNAADWIERVDAAERRSDRAIHLRLSRAQTRVHQLGTERAAAVLVRRLNRIALRLDDCENRSRDVLRQRAQRSRRQLESIEARLRRQDLALRVVDARRRLAVLEQRSTQASERCVANARKRLELVAAKLGQLSPLRVLDRGYALVQDDAGRVITDAAAVIEGAKIAVRLARGRLDAAVERTSKE